jgi:endoglucanase
MKDLFGILSDLSDFVSPSGMEKKLGEYLASECEKLGAVATVDVMGNVIARKAGAGKKVILCAHMDTTGFIATFVEDSGYVRFGPLGGLNRRDILFSPVVFQNGAMGVIAKDDAVKEEDLKLSNLFIDIGAKDGEEAKGLVSPGDAAVFSAKPALVGERVFSPYLDNRIGVAVLLEVLEGLKSSPNDLYFVFSTQEEVGLRGVRTATYAVNPDYAIAVDVTDVGDNPDPKPKMAVKLGGGPTVKIMDRSVICHPEMVQAIVGCAEKYGIPLQREIMQEGGTDAGMIHISREGVKTGGVSIPSRYIHSPAECVDLRDAEKAVTLLVKLLEEGLQ